MWNVAYLLFLWLWKSHKSLPTLFPQVKILIQSTCILVRSRLAHVCSALNNQPGLQSMAIRRTLSSALCSLPQGCLVVIDWFHLSAAWLTRLCQGPLDLMLWQPLAWPHTSLHASCFTIHWASTIQHPWDSSAFLPIHPVHGMFWMSSPNNKFSPFLPTLGKPTSHASTEAMKCPHSHHPWNCFFLPPCTRKTLCIPFTVPLTQQYNCSWN